MLAVARSAQPDHFHPALGVKHRILPPAPGDIGARGIEKLGRRLGTTGGEEEERNEALHPWEDAVGRVKVGLMGGRLFHPAHIQRFVFDNFGPFEIIKPKNRIQFDASIYPIKFQHTAFLE